MRIYYTEVGMLVHFWVDLPPIQTYRYIQIRGGYSSKEKCIILSWVTCFPPCFPEHSEAPRPPAYPTQILLFFSLRQLRSQLSLMVIARMLGQQESLPLSGEKTQVSLPQQDEALVGHNPSPDNLPLPEV